jgi:hypothetical protein
VVVLSSSMIRVNHGALRSMSLLGIHGYTVWMKHSIQV